MLEGYKFWGIRVFNFRGGVDRAPPPPLHFAIHSQYYFLSLALLDSAPGVLVCASIRFSESPRRADSKSPIFILPDFGTWLPPGPRGQSWQDLGVGGRGGVD